MTVHKTYRGRLRKLRRHMKSAGVPALLVTKFENVTYLTGFSGDDSSLLVTRNDQVVLSDFRYTTQLETECPGFELEIRKQGETMLQRVAQVVKRMGIAKLGIEADSLVVGEFSRLKNVLERVELQPTHGSVETLREIKDRSEVDSIRHSVYLAERAFRLIRAALVGDQTERAIAAELEYRIRQFGGQGCSFPPIVAVGDHAALPHAVPTERRVSESELMLVDWGAKAGGYASDLTRVLVTGKISPKLERVYGVVLKAQTAAINAIRPGARMCDVDAAARTVIEEAGYGKRFGHGLGHGIGLEIHEAPRLSVNQTRPLEAGMVVTVEPGIYLPGWGGVRIEDDVLVTADGHEVLSHLSKEIADCVVS